MKTCRYFFLLAPLFSLVACATSTAEEVETTPEATSDSLTEGVRIGASVFVGDWLIPFCAATVPATFTGNATNIIGLTLQADGTYVARSPNAATTCAGTNGKRCLEADVGRWAMRSSKTTGKRLVLRSARGGGVREMIVSSGHVIQAENDPFTVVTPGATAATVKGQLLYPVREFVPSFCQICADTERLVLAQGDEPRHCEFRNPQPPPLPVLNEVEVTTSSAVGPVGTGNAVVQDIDDGEVVSVSIDGNLPNSFVDVFIEHDGVKTLLAEVVNPGQLSTAVDDFHGQRARGKWTVSVTPRLNPTTQVSVPSLRLTIKTR